MSASDLPPMAGAYRVEANALRFEPQFPLEPGLRYRAVFRPDQLPGGNKAAPITSAYQSPMRSATPATLVSRVYPSADTLPENLLKFYVHFTGPMSRGNIYDHIRLRDENGRDVELPFLEIERRVVGRDDDAADADHRSGTHQTRRPTARRDRPGARSGKKLYARDRARVA